MATALVDLRTRLAPSVRAFAEAAALLRSSDSMSETLALIQAHLAALYPSDDDWLGGPYVRDLFDDTVVFSYRNQLFRCSYRVRRKDDTPPAVTLGAAEGVEIAYTPVRAAPPGREAGRPLRSAVASLRESAVREAAVRPGGAIEIKVIEPGWGSSGYYSAAMLERDGPAAFPAGTKMYWDHPTLSEEDERPERSLRDLAGELTGPSRWRADGPAGPGLYADAVVFEHYRAAVDELAPHIGVSIRALGETTPGEADGRAGLMIDALTTGISVDFVTVPGAGGQIVQLFESARHAPAPPPVGRPRAEKENPVDDATAQALQESVDRLSSRVEGLQRENAQLRGDRVIEAAISATDLPIPARARIASVLLGKAAVDADGRIDEAATQALVTSVAEAERAYINQVAPAGSGISGMGGRPTLEMNDADVARKLEESLAALGLTDVALTAAVKGRG